jgi:hypothetical protein
MGTKFCSTCGKPIDSGALFCAHCGAKQGAPRQAPPAAAPGPYPPVPPQGKPPKKVWPLVTALSVVAVAVAAVLALMLTGVIKLGGAAPVVSNPTPVVTPSYAPPVPTATPEVSFTPGTDVSIVGSWAYTDQDGVIYNMTFQPDGTCSFYTSEDYDTFTGTYTLNGNLLTVTEDGADSSNAVLLSVFRDGDQLTLIDPETLETRVFTPSEEAAPATP